MAFAASIVDRIDAEVAASSVASTPFIQAWLAGELNRDDLRTFAAQYYHQVAAFPRYVSRLHSVCESVDTRRTLLEILTAAEGSSPTLADMWLRTCAALGLFSDTVRASTPSAGTASCISVFRELCGQGEVAGLAALYSCTTQLPQLCRGMRDALEHHYGMNPGPGLQFFELREYAGSQHAKLLRNTLEQAIGNEDDVRTALGAAQRACDALIQLYVLEPAAAAV